MRATAAAAEAPKQAAPVVGVLLEVAVRLEVELLVAAVAGLVQAVVLVMVGVVGAVDVVDVVATAALSSTAGAERTDHTSPSK